MKARPARGEQIVPNGDVDFFVSYTKKDLRWARRIVSWLQGAGYSVIAQYKDFPPGVNWFTEMDKALRRSRRTIAVLSQDYLEADFCTLEWQNSMKEDPSGSRRKLIPIQISEVDFGGSLLEQVEYVDLVGLRRGKAKKYFIEAVAAAVTGAELPLHPSLPRRQSRRPRGRLIFPPGLGREDGFVGRDEILGSLRAGYFDDAGEPLSSARRILCGMSGTGKTQIAVEYGYRNADSYETVLFVGGGSREAVSSSYAALAEPLGLAVRVGITAGITAVRDFLDRTGRFLLIFDDVEHDYLDGLLPRRGHVLATTRSPRWPDAKNVIRIGTFTRQESIRLVVDRMPATDHQDADGFAADLGDLPVALDSLSKNAQDTGRSIAALRQVLAEYPGMVTGEDDERQPAGGFWKQEIINLARPEGKPAAACLLRMVALLAPDWDIPHALFEANPAVLPDQMRADPNDDVPWLGRVIGPAVSSSWFVRTPPDHFAMHKVVALSIQQSMSEAERYRLRRSLVLLLHEAGLGSNAAISQSPEVWTWWAKMLPHVSALVNDRETAEAIAGGDPPDNWADLVRKVADLADRSATYLCLVGAWDEAVQLHRRALAILALVDGADAVSTAEALRNLAGTLLACGAVEAAVTAAERALANDKQYYESTDSVIASDLRMLASALLDANDADAAARHAVRSLEMVTGRALGGDGPTASDAMGIDTMLIDIAAAGAKNLTRSHVRMDEVSDSLGLLAAIALRKGQVKSATMLLETARQLDASHRAGRRPRPVEADRFFQLAELAEKQGDTAKAAELSAEARRLAEEAFELKDPLLAQDYHLRRVGLSIPAQGEPR